MRRATAALTPTVMVTAGPGSDGGHHRLSAHANVAKFDLGFRSSLGVEP